MSRVLCDALPPLNVTEGMPPKFFRAHAAVGIDKEIWTKLRMRSSPYCRTPFLLRHLLFVAAAFGVKQSHTVWHWLWHSIWTGSRHGENGERMHEMHDGCGKLCHIRWVRSLIWLLALSSHWNIGHRATIVLENSPCNMPSPRLAISWWRGDF